MRPKGQLISKCPFGVQTSSKKPTKLFPGFCPEIFCTFLGASWKLFGASCRLPYLRYYLLSPQEAQKASRKPPGSCKKIQGRIQEIISLVFWKKFLHQKDILKLTDLYLLLYELWRRKCLFVWYFLFTSVIVVLPVESLFEKAMEEIKASEKNLWAINRIAPQQNKNGSCSQAKVIHPKYYKHHFGR